MSTFNGIGTKFYGSTDKGPDGSYITTKWFVIVYLPIIPIDSFRVIKESSSNYVVYSNTQYRVQKVPPHWKQIGKTYLLVYGIIGLIILGVSIFG